VGAVTERGGIPRRQGTVEKTSRLGNTQLTAQDMHRQRQSTVMVMVMVMVVIYNLEEAVNV
jgi:hypothetical protein